MGGIRSIRSVAGSSTASGERAGACGSIWVAPSAPRGRDDPGTAAGTTTVVASLERFSPVGCEVAGAHGAAAGRWGAEGRGPATWCAPAGGCGSGDGRAPGEGRWAAARTVGASPSAGWPLAPRPFPAWPPAGAPFGAWPPAVRPFGCSPFPARPSGAGARPAGVRTVGLSSPPGAAGPDGAGRGDGRGDGVGRAPSPSARSAVRTGESGCASPDAACSAPPVSRALSLISGSEEAVASPGDDCRSGMKSVSPRRSDRAEARSVTGTAPYRARCAPWRRRALPVPAGPGRWRPARRPRTGRRVRTAPGHPP
ncbi:hypothetical protein FHX44_113537 [Pseudonocardia hierapolitana]|uniref:Uncharacterized protein n=1 Tax=Pseudonocardia hierapolitana TaxID=1128676 RepID=A0A561SRX3_9PSEU|nr:hypothetical protein FHX44_113537 [Pseudonocardia hierapolitana]